MPTRSRVLPLLAACVLAACSSQLEPSGCRSDETCPATARCRGGVCVAGARPVASVRAPGALEEFALVHLDGSASHDPDGAADVVDHVWTVRAVSASCEAPRVAGRSAVVLVRFGCPGGYEVSLVVRDGLGLESEPATVPVEVVRSRLPPAVIAGADVVSDHACAGDPTLCRPTERIALSASAVPGASLRWTVQPPVDRPADDTRRVGFLPGADVPSPEVIIESDGTAISGDWIFRVEASDAYGVLGAAHTRVSISNRPPIVVVAAPAAVPHRFDAARSTFVARGEIAFSVTDPDGDPVAFHGELRHAGDGGAPLLGELTDDRLAFTIEVPYERPEDALRLVGGPGLERVFEIVAVDVNRVAARAIVPIVVGNRPPAPVGAPAEVRAPHRFDAAGSRYVAVAELGAWSDPDGDPLSAAPGVAPCAALSVVDGVARVECAVTYEGVPAAGRIAGRYAVPVRVRDPWSEGPAYVQNVEVLNSPPRIAVTTHPATVTPNAYFFPRGLFPPQECRDGRTSMWLGEISFTATPAVSDPDGDPMLVTPSPSVWIQRSASPAAAACTEASCVSFAFHHERRDEVCPGDATVSAVVVTDGAATASAAADPRIVWPPYFGF